VSKYFFHSLITRAFGSLHHGNGKKLTSYQTFINITKLHKHCLIGELNDNKFNKNWVIT
jgi:hypothetical protein